MNRARHYLLLITLALGAPPLSAHLEADVERDMLGHLIGENPAEPALYIQRGESWSRDGEYASALADFDTAARLGDVDALLFPRGQTYYRMGDFERALACFDKLLDRQPDFVPALLYRARILRDSGRAQAAVLDFDSLFRLQPQSDPGYYLSAAQLSLGLRDRGVDGALRTIDLGIANLGVLVTLQDYAISLEQQRGHYGAALARLETLKPQTGNSPDWKIKKGRLLAAAGSAEESHRYYRQAQQQLNTLRATPARIALQEELSALMQQR